MIEQSPLIIDIAGLELGPQDRARLAHPLVGGMILFARNWRDRAAAHRAHSVDQVGAPMTCWSASIMKAAGCSAFRTDGFTHVPPMRALGELWMDDGKRQRSDGGHRRGQRLRLRARQRAARLRRRPVLHPGARSGLDHEGPSAA
jgi:beta-N-acetylhexosaminidase